jgi:PAS domain S-box-containing protein
MDRFFVPDIRSTILNYIVISIVSILVLIVLWRQNRRRYAGTGYWIASFSIQTCGMALILLRTIVPDWASFILSNTMIMTGLLLSLIGFERFAGRIRTQYINILIIFLFTLLQGWFTYYSNDLAARKLIFSIAFMALSAQNIWFVLKKTSGQMRNMLSGAVWIYCGFCIVSVLRIIKFFLDRQPSTDFFQNEISEALIILTYQLLYVLLVFILVLIYIKRVLVDISLQEEKYIKAFQSSPYGIIFTRMIDGKIIEVNKGFTKISGYSASEVLGRTTKDIHFWENDNTRLNFVEEVKQKNVIIEMEQRFRRKSGELFYGLFSSEIIVLNNENHLLSSINDITDRKEAEAAIAKTERYFRRLIEKSSDGVVLINREGKMTYASPSARRMFGYLTTDTELPDPGLKTHPDDLPLVNETIQKIVINPQLIMTIEYRFMKKDMTYSWIESTFTNLFAEEGIESIVINFRDISERKKAEAVIFQRLELQDQLAKIAYTVPGMIFSFRMYPDGSFKLPFCTPVIKDLWGFRPEDLKDDFSPAFDRIHPDDIEAARERIRESARTLNPWIDSFRVLHPEKGEIWLDGQSMPRLENDGSIIWHGFVQDITNRKKAEEAIKLLNEDLEKRVIERTSQLENALLELESFSYSVSHDLRAPLRAINGYSRILKEDYEKSLDEEGRRLCTRIESSAVHMSQLIDDLLAFSRVGRHELLRSEIDMTSLVNTVYNELTSEPGSEQISFMAENLPPAFGDLATIKQVVTNLLSNAIKYSSLAGRPMIHTGSQRENGSIIYFVRDNGIGFDMKHINKLFGVFQRLPNSEEFEGNGVGLAIVQRVITRHGGSIWAEGIPGRGATFYFTIPSPK